LCAHQLTHTRTTSNDGSTAYYLRKDVWPVGRFVCVDMIQELRIPRIRKDGHRESTVIHRVKMASALAEEEAAIDLPQGHVRVFIVVRWSILLVGIVRS